MILFPGFTQLDLTGPYEVFARMPSTEVHLVAASVAPVRSERGLAIVPNASFDSVAPLDVLVVPGGPGVDRMMEDETLLQFLREQGQGACYVTSVCTGALLLGAAGLLRGYPATTHWLSLDLLPLFAAETSYDRVVIDRNRITGGGVTAGIDFGLVVASELFGSAVAQAIQLIIEYDPVPPFNSGTTRTAPADLVHRVIESRKATQAQRRTIAERVAARLHEAGT